MTWLVWRQQRLTWWLVAASLAVTFGLATYGHVHVDRLVARPGYFEAASFSGLNDGYGVAVVAALAAPLLVGLFLGVSVFAPELEHRTHVLVLTQEVSRTRWYTVKVATAASVALAVGAALAGAFDWSWAVYIDAFGMSRVEPFTVGAIGPAPAAFTVLATAIGMIAGLTLRRTLAAVAATLVGFAALRTGILVATLTFVPPDEVTSLPGQPPGGPLPAGGHLVDQGFRLADGRRVFDSDRLYTEILDACADSAGCLSQHGVVAEFQTYHFPHHFWALQAVSSGLAVAVTAILLGFGLWWARRRVS